MNVRVTDIAAFDDAAVAKGARLLTEPIDRKAELRCYLHDPDGLTGPRELIHLVRESFIGVRAPA